MRDFLEKYLSYLGIDYNRTKNRYHTRDSEKIDVLVDSISVYLFPNLFLAKYCLYDWNDSNYIRLVFELKFRIQNAGYLTTPVAI